jgi:hypothetical protein
LGLIERGFERFELAELYWTLVPDSGDGPAEQTQCDFRGQIRKTPQFNRDRGRTGQFNEQFRDSALDGFLDRDVRPLEPAREPGQLRGIETFLSKQMHQTA